ncbi:non-ribosomal peptide synthetase [Thermocatellispora tengchongensis]|uniref:non-ribosomal peptide synthetase n=1 Tax=Thermocatellispora tengchongensis TaxID=1073253 RepID=UPI0036399BC1
MLGLDAEEIDEDEDLFRQGLDSLGLIRLAGGWRRMGLPVTFEDLAEQATLRHWRSLLAGRAQAGTPLQAAAPEVDERAPFDLATMQHAYWVGRRPGQPFGEVAAHFYVEFDGSGVDPERLDAALGALAARHAMLRARFLDDGRQRIAEEPALPHVTVRDLRGLTPEQAAARLEELREHYTHRRMDVDRGEVFEVALTLLPGGATRMHVDLDMIVADALSMRVLLGDLRTLYEGGELPPIGYSFPRYLAERGPRRAAERERARAWWRERMAGLPSAPRLPTRAEAGHADRPRTVRLHHWIDAAAKRRLLALAQQHGVTPAAALATVFAEVIGAWSGDERFLLNLPLFDRERLHPDVDLLVGDFSGSVLLDADVSGAVPFAERARLLQDRLRAAIAHGAYGGVEVLRDLRREGRDALAPVVYTSALGLGEIYDEPLQRRFGRPVWIISQGPQVWLDAQVTELDHGLLLNWDVREDVLAPGVAQAAFGAYRDLIESLLASAEAWRRPVGPLLPAGQAAVRAAVNDTGRALPSRLLHEGFFLRAAEAPGRVALIEDGGRLTYGELAASALRVAALLRAHGVRPGDSVVITLPKGGGQVAAVLGVLAAGACYVPIGVDQPAPRRARIHERAGARAVLTDENHAEAVAEAVRQAAGTAPVLLLGDADACEPLAAPVAHEADAPAYVLFTSGSTGEPKGVEVSHRAAVNTVESLNARFGIGPDDRVLTVSALDFDLSVYDVFGLLSAGGALVVVPEDARRDAAAWWRLVSRHGVTVWNTVPALLDMLLTAAGYTPHEASPALRVVLLGGDWVGLDLPGRLRAVAPGCRFAALGGMTEAAIHSTVFEVDRVDDAWRSMPWGTPLDNVRCRVVDARGRDCPDWVAGELWVGGASVANGYRGDPARTAERFVEHDGLRWYRSGDLARYRPDGVLEFLGRADHQVKVRGHRIELGEIEAALEAHPAVGRAVAAVLRGASQRLAAAVAAREPVTEQELIGWLTERLPGYMVCEHIAVRPSLPLTANGKPDRAAVLRVLAEEAGDRAETAEPPEGELESLVAKVWAELLGVDRVGRHDSFFELGGDSLLATRLVGLLRAEGVSGCRLTALFASPRLAGFAATLTLGAEEPGAPEAVPALVADPANRHEPFPPTDVQRVYWIGRDERLPLGGVGTWQYAEFDGTGVDLDRLEAAWRRLIDRHEMLRAVFDEDGDQRILAEVPEFRIEVRDATGGTDADADEALAELRRDKSHRLADLTRWPLFDVAAVRYRRGGEVRTRVAIGLDYILFDALSIMTLFSELDLLYRDPGAALAPIEMSFRDYVLQVRPDPEIAARDQEYWRSRVADLPATPRLPLTRHPAQVARPRFTRRQRWLPPGPWRAFKEAASRHGLTPPPRCWPATPRSSEPGAARRSSPSP